MRGLFTKIFLGFWIAQSLTFVISTMLILQHRFVRPNEIIEVLDTTLPSTVGAAVNAYEAGGCGGLQQYGAIDPADYLPGRYAEPFSLWGYPLVGDRCGANNG